MTSQPLAVRKYWIDYAKAIGIALVVFGHVIDGLHKAGIGFSDTVFEIAYSIIYTFHMPLFFFLSGIFFEHSFFKRGTFGLTANKLDTLIYPYVFWSILQGGMEAGLSTYTNGNLSWSEVFTLWTPRAQFWFLYALFLIFMTTTLIYSALKGRFILGLLALSVLFYLNRNLLPGGFIFSFIAHYWFYFVAGIVYSRYAQNISLHSTWLLALAAGAFIAGQWIFHDQLDLRFRDRGPELLFLSIISITAVLSLSGYLSQKPRKRILLIGSASMAIYLMHVIFGSGTRIFLQKFLNIDSTPIHLLAGLLTGIGGPTLVFLLIRKYRIPGIFSAPGIPWVKRQRDQAS